MLGIQAPLRSAATPRLARQSLQVVGPCTSCTRVVTSRTFQQSTKQLKAVQSSKPTKSPISTTTVTSTAPPVRVTWVHRLWNAYSESLQSRPLATKMTAAALIFFTSDSATQYIMDQDAPWEPSRAWSGAAFGVVATGWLHYWWGFLETVVGARVKGRLANSLTKVFIDQACGAVLYIYGYYVLTNSVKTLADDPQQNVGKVLAENDARARDMLWPTMMRHWSVWPFVHSINFYYVPLQHRVLVQNGVLVFWSAYLSHLNNGGLAETDGKLMTPKEEIEVTMKRRETGRA